MDGVTLPKVKKKWKDALHSSISLLERIHTEENASPQWTRAVPSRDGAPDEIPEQVQLAVMRRRVANTDVFRATWEGMWDEGAGGVVDLEAFFALFSSQELLSQWLPLVESSTMIEALGSHTRVCKTCFRLGWPASPRDAVLLAHTVRDDKRVLHVATSVPRTADAPSYLRPSPPYIRTQIHLLALFVACPSPERVALTVYWSMDARGSMLGVRPNAMASSVPRMLPKMAAYAKTQGMHVPYVHAFGAGLVVTSERAATALHVEFILVHDDDDDQVFDAEAALPRSICVRMSAKNAWDVRLRTLDSAGGCPAYTSKLTRIGAWYELCIQYEKLEDAHATLHAALETSVRTDAEEGVYVDDFAMEATEQTPHASDNALLARLALSEQQTPSGNVDTVQRGIQGLSPLAATVRRNYIYFTSLLQEPEAKWRRVSDVRGVTVTQLESIDPTLVVYRAEATFVGLTVWDLYSALNSPAMVRRWNVALDDATLIQDLGGQSAVWHVRYAPAWLAQARDATLVQTAYQSPTSIHVFSFSADEHISELPAPAPGTVRMQVDLCGWSIEALSPTTVHVTLVEQSDPRGWLSKTRIPPQMIVAMAGAGEHVLRHGAPPCISRLFNARVQTQAYGEDSFDVSYVAAACDAPDATHVECVLWASLEGWAPNLDVLVDPPPSSTSCLRRHRLAGGGGLWITLEHRVADLSEQCVRVCVRKGPAKSLERGVVLLNGARVHVDVEGMDPAQLQALARMKRTKPRHVPLDLPVRASRSADGYTEPIVESAAEVREPEVKPPTHPALDALALLRCIHAERHPDPAGPQGGWSLMSEKNGVYVHRRLVERISPHVMVHRTDKIIQGVAAEDLLPLVADPHARCAWDEHLASCRMLESFGSGTNTALWTSHASFLFAPRMFVVSSISAHGHGADVPLEQTSPVAAQQPVYFHATASCDASRWDMSLWNPDARPIGTVLMDGWIFENVDPYSMEQYAIPSTRCIYVVAIDYGGVPRSLNALWNASLPECVVQLERWVSQHVPLSSVRMPPRCVNVHGDARDDSLRGSWTLHRGRRASTLVTCDFEHDTRTQHVVAIVDMSMPSPKQLPALAGDDEAAETSTSPAPPRLSSRGSAYFHKRSAAAEPLILVDIQVALQYYPQGYDVQVTWSHVEAGVCDLAALPASPPTDAMPIDVRVLDIQPSALQAATHTHAEPSHRHCVRVTLPERAYTKPFLVRAVIAPLEGRACTNATPSHVPVTINHRVAEICYGHESAREPLDVDVDQLEHMSEPTTRHVGLPHVPIASVAAHSPEAASAAAPTPSTENVSAADESTDAEKTAPTAPAPSSTPLMSLLSPQGWYDGVMSLVRPTKRTDTEASVSPTPNSQPPTSAAPSNASTSVSSPASPVSPTTQTNQQVPMPRGGYQLSTLILFMILAFLLGSLTRAFVQPADFVLMPFTSNNAVPAAPARSEVKEGESLRMIDVAAREIDNFVRAARQLHTFARFGYSDEATLAEQEARSECLEESGMVRWHEMHRFVDIYLPGLPWRLVMGLAGV